jgi:hypothetical protein
VLKRLIKKNYVLSKLYYEFLFEISSAKGKDPLIVYQVGKVGSRSIANLLASLNLNRKVYHIHSLRPQTLRQIRKIYYGEAPGCWFKRYLPRSNHLLQSYFLYRHLNRGLGRRRRQWQVVVMIREPVARNVSSFFQTLDLRIPDFIEKYQTNLITIDQLQRIFIEEFEGHQDPLVWLDEELKAMLGVDVYATPFPKTKGYQIYQGEMADILLIKLEMLNQCAQDAFKEFLGIDAFVPPRDNVASDKEYARIYKDFLQSLALPVSYLDTMYRSKFVNHFYSNEEIHRFLAKWSKQPESSASVAYTGNTEMS